MVISQGVGPVLRQGNEMLPVEGELGPLGVVVNVLHLVVGGV
jgi:hypothetical protein